MSRWYNPENRNPEPLLFYYWPSVADGGPTLKQQSCLMGIHYIEVLVPGLPNLLYLGCVMKNYQGESEPVTIDAE